MPHLQLDNSWEQDTNSIVQLRMDSMEHVDYDYPQVSCT